MGLTDELLRCLKLNCWERMQQEKKWIWFYSLFLWLTNWLQIDCCLTITGCERFTQGLKYILHRDPEAVKTLNSYNILKYIYIKHCLYCNNFNAHFEFGHLNIVFMCTVNQRCAIFIIFDNFLFLENTSEYYSIWQKLTDFFNDKLHPKNYFWTLKNKIKSTTLLHL